MESSFWGGSFHSCKLQKKNNFKITTDYVIKKEKKNINKKNFLDWIEPLKHTTGRDVIVITITKGKHLSQS